MATVDDRLTAMFAERLAPERDAAFVAKVAGRISRERRGRQAMGFAAAAGVAVLVVGFGPLLGVATAVLTETLFDAVSPSTLAVGLALAVVGLGLARAYA
jgi:hypothetical protein